MRYWPWTLLLCFALPLVAKEKKPIGDILERDLFLKARTFCVDTRKLSAAEALDVRKFLDAESKPKKMLSKIPWQLVPECTQADAIVKIEFTQQIGLTQATQGMGTLQGVPMTGVPVTKFQASLQIFDRVSTKLIYQAVSGGSNTRRDQSLSGPFSILAKDLKAISEGDASR
ncbi:MAG: hypothetical protein ABSA70_05215 [Terriglobia bacterium]